MSQLITLNIYKGHLDSQLSFYFTKGNNLAKERQY
jgi:hypothetical protein